MLAAFLVCEFIVHIVAEKAVCLLKIDRDSDDSPHMGFR